MRTWPGCAPGACPPPRWLLDLTHVGGDDDEGPQVGPPQVARHVAEVVLEAAQQLGRALLAPLDVLPRCPGAWRQEGTAGVDDILVRHTDRWHSARGCGRPGRPGLRAGAPQVPEGQAGPGLSGEEMRRPPYTPGIQGLCEHGRGSEGRTCGVSGAREPSPRQKPGAGGTCILKESETETKFIGPNSQAWIEVQVRGPSLPGPQGGLCGQGDREDTPRALCRQGDPPRALRGQGIRRGSVQTGEA